MKIEVNHTDEHNDYFTLTDDQGKEYQWHGRKGVKQNPEKVLLMIRKKEYPGADYKAQKGETELEAMECWITEEHKIKGKVVAKKEWESTHSKKIKGIASLKKAKTVADIKAALLEVLE